MSPSPHSWRMSRVRSTGNKSTEAVFVSLLRTARISGWRRHLDLLGRPDFTFRTERLVVFIDGCFWHGCRRCKKIPHANEKFWSQKMAYNRQRASAVNRGLRSQGWVVYRVWEHELKYPAPIVEHLQSLLNHRQD